MSRVRHTSPVPPERRTTAPYNFVPLPDAPLLFASASLESQGQAADPQSPTRSFDTFASAGRLSGVIEYKVECLTPIYTRAALPTDANERSRVRTVGRDEDKLPQSADFYHHGDLLKPILPGSTLRGMVRSVVRILSAGKFPKSKDRRLFFRSFSGGIMNQVYSRHFVEDVRRVPGPAGVRQGYRNRSEAGFLIEDSGEWFIEPCHELRVARVKLPLHPSQLYVVPRGSSDSERNPSRIPNPDHQYREVWVKVPSLEKDWHLHMSDRGGGMYSFRRNVDSIRWQHDDAHSHQGYLVITGNMQNKKSEFVFVRHQERSRLPVPMDVIQDVQDEDQISKWQENAFPPSGKLDPERATRHGLPGLPVWFLKDEQGMIICLGRSQNFRLRYTHRTRAFVPADLGAEDVADLDFAERLFGRVPVQSQRETTGDEHSLRQQVRGRVCFLDARCETPSPFLGALRMGGPPEPYRVPRVLSSPKPTAFQLYLTQPRAEEPSLVHYDVATPGEVRGTKLYWHRNRADSQGVIQPPGAGEMFKETLDLSKQETLSRPVRPGSTFVGQIRFQNLERAELGALLAALDLPAGLAHKLGMGKPLGLGSVRIDVTRVTLDDRQRRYSTWDTTDTPLPNLDAEVQNAKDDFRKLMVSHHLQKEPALPPVEKDIDLWALPRPAQLAALLQWKDAPEANATRYTTLDPSDAQKWRRRNVLPSALEVLGKNPSSGMPTPPPGDATPPANINKPRVLIHGLRVVRLLKPRGQQGPQGPTQSWDAIHPETGITLEVRRVRILPNQRGKEWAQVNVYLLENRWVADFLALTTEPTPDNLPHESRSVAEIVGGSPGQWEARLIRGTRTWQLRGTPPPGVSAAIGAKVTVRVVRPLDSKDHYLAFALERS